MKEIRCQSQTELRADPDGRRLSGLAIKFNTLSENLGGFRERIAPAAFDHSLRDDDQVLLREHQPSMLLARRSAGTLTIRRDALGVHFSATLPKTQLGDDVIEAVRRRDLQSCSFGFVCLDDDVRLEDVGGSRREFVREVREGILLDVSCVCFPAYGKGATSLALRSIGGVALASSGTSGLRKIMELHHLRFKREHERWLKQRESEGWYG